MTRCIVLGEVPEEKREPHRIGFEWYLVNECMIEPAETPPSEFKVIELVCRNYVMDKYDLMFAHDNEREGGILFLGHWNDGVV